MKTTTIRKVGGQTRVRRLLYAVHSQHELTEEQHAALRRKAWKRCVNNTSTTEQFSNDYGYMLLLFDYYVVEKLSVMQRLRHRFCMVKAAVLAHIGVSTVVVVVERKA